VEGNIGCGESESEKKPIVTLGVGDVAGAIIKLSPKKGLVERERKKKPDEGVSEPKIRVPVEEQRYLSPPQNEMGPLTKGNERKKGESPRKKDG